MGLSAFTGNSEDRVRKDLNRDFYLTATEAVDYGLIDKVSSPVQPPFPPPTATDASKASLSWSGLQRGPHVRPQEGLQGGPGMPTRARTDCKCAYARTARVRRTHNTLCTRTHCKAGEVRVKDSNSFKWSHRQRTEW